MPEDGQEQMADLNAWPAVFPAMYVSRLQWGLLKGTQQWTFNWKWGLPTNVPVAGVLEYNRNKGEIIWYSMQWISDYKMHTFTMPQ